MPLTIDFLIIGAHKSGTTSLYHYLMQHPDIFLPEIEENRFFTKEEFFRQGDKFLSIFYTNIRKERIIGGKNVHTMYFPDARLRLCTHNPNMKIIAILRNPITRAYSAYWFARRNGWESCETFEEALEKETSRSRGNYKEQAELTYLSHGHYYEQLISFLDKLGPDNVFIALTQDLKAVPHRVVSDILRWLGLDPNLVPIDVTKRKMVASMPRFPWFQKIVMSRDTWYKTAARSILRQKFCYSLQHRILNRLAKINLTPSQYPPMKEATRQWLVDYYSIHNEKLARLIGKDLSCWQ